MSSENKTANIAIPTAATLHPAYPNPFNPQTTITYSLNRNGHVVLAVFDMTGRKIETLINRFQNSGDHRIVLDASTLTSGTYMIRLEVDGFTQSRKVTLLK
jgi:biopolymer transport protein ExbD